MCHQNTKQSISIQIKQFQADFNAERKDKEAAAIKLADREKVLMKQNRRAEEERDHFQALAGKHHAEEMVL